MFKIKLELDGRNYDLDNVSYSSSNYAATPENEGYKDSVNISMSIKLNKIDQTLLDWGLNGASQRKDGKITVFDPDRDMMVKMITFKKGYCGSLSGSVYGHDDYNTYPIVLNITAEKLAVQLEKSKGKRISDD